MTRKVGLKSSLGVQVLADPQVNLKKGNWNYIIAGSILVFLPWLLGSSYIWSFSADTFIVPLTADTFSLMFAALKSHRIVLPFLFLHPALVLFSFLGPLLLSVLFGLLYLLFSGSRLERFLLALFVTTCFYKAGAPGLVPSSLFQVSLCILTVYVFFRPISKQGLWALSTFLVLLCFLFPRYNFLVFWLAFSMSAGHLVGFLFAEKAHVPRKFRKNFMESFSYLLGLAVLVAWVFFTLNAIGHWDDVSFQPSKFWWGAWFFCLLTACLAYLEPWKISRWLSLAIFFQGLLFSKDLELPVLIAGILVIQRLVSHFQIADKASRAPKWALRLSIASILFGCIGWMSYQMRQFQPERVFQGQWVSAYKQIRADSEGKSFLVMGHGFPFLASFLSDNIAQADGFLLESSEEKFSQLLLENHFTDIIVEKSYLMEFWRSWITEGHPPETSNHSIVSRIVAYGGEEVHTQTLNLPAVRNFEAKEFEKAPDFVWIRPKSKK